jgi:SPP1 gp7 family putative phage head morphogenesis protein
MSPKKGSPRGTLRGRKFTLLRKRAPKPQPPLGIQVQYYSEIKRILAYARMLVRERLLSWLPEFIDRHAEQHGDRLDAQHPRDSLEGRFFSGYYSREDAQHPSKRVGVILEGIARSVERRFPRKRLEQMAQSIATLASEHQGRELFRQIKSTTGIELSTIQTPKLGAKIRRFTAENASLIKTVPAQYLADVEKVTLAGLRAGTRYSDLKVELEERAGVAESRSKLIARDQTSKLVGEINQARQEALGVTSYVWRTVGDERVREPHTTKRGRYVEGHTERDGQTYRWDDPPGADPTDPATGGHPGAAINCRCWAEPLIEDLLNGD